MMLKINSFKLPVFTLLLSFFLLLPLVHAEANMRKIPSELLVNGINKNIQEVLTSDPNIKNKVQHLFSLNLLEHDMTRYIDENADFEKYWSIYGSYWFELHSNDYEVLIFNGYAFFDEYKEKIELYMQNEEGVWTKSHASDGQIIGFKKHPRTNEIILYTHDYPCCTSASHTLRTVRMVNGMVKIKKRFFLGRESGDMVGPFFPDYVQFPNIYDTLKKNTVVRWSPEVVDSLAFVGRTHSNRIITFNKGGIYQSLFKLDDWEYVLLFNGMMSTESDVIHYSNFTNKPIYAWIRNVTLKVNA